MSTLAIVSHVGLWVVVSCLFAMVFALARQVGLMHRRLAPTGARMLADGPPIGQAAPDIDLLDVQGRHVRYVGARAKLTLMIFAAPGCSSCAELMPAVRTLWRAERRYLDVLICSLMRDETRTREFAAEYKLEPIAVVASPDLATQYQVRMPPYAVLVGADGLVKAKGLVNHLEHLESLLTAARLGHATIETYARMARASSSPAPAEPETVGATGPATV